MADELELDASTRSIRLPLSYSALAVETLSVAAGFTVSVVDRVEPLALAGKQTGLAYKDEVNVFRRTILYAGLPNSARFYDVAGAGEKPGARSLIYLGKRHGVATRAFRTFLTDELVPALVTSGAFRELRTQVFMPWIERLWDTPNVAHDNPADQRFHASLILGFTDATAMRAFFGGGAIAALSVRLAEFVSAAHAYEVTEALTYVKDGKVLPHYQ